MTASTGCDPQLLLDLCKGYLRGAFADLQRPLHLVSDDQPVQTEDVARVPEYELDRLQADARIGAITDDVSELLPEFSNRKPRLYDGQAPPLGRKVRQEGLLGVDREGEGR